MNRYKLRPWWTAAAVNGAMVLCLGTVCSHRGAIAQVLPVAGNPRQAAVVDQAELRARDQGDDASQRAGRSGYLMPGRVPGISTPNVNAAAPRPGVTSTGLGGSLAGTAGAGGFGTGLPAVTAGATSGINGAGIQPGSNIAGSSGFGGARSNSAGAGKGSSGLGSSLAARTPYSTVPPAGAAAGAATQTAIPPMVGTGGVGLGVGTLRGSGVGGYGGSTTGLGVNTASGLGVGAVSPAMGGLGQTTIQPGTTAGGIGLGSTSSPTGGLGGSLPGAAGGAGGIGGPSGTIGTAGGGATTGSASSGGATTSGLGGSGGGAGAGGS